MVERQRQRLAVEVAAGDDVAVAVAGEDERVVGHRVQLALERDLDVAQRIVDGAEDLRRAAQRVGILHAAAVGVAGDDLAAVQQRAQPRGDLLRAGVRAHAGQALVERHGRALERLQRQRQRHDRDVEQAPRIAHRQPAGRRHEVRAVDERQPLLGLERDGLQARAGQRGGPVQALAVELRLALADEHERDVRQRSEVTRGSDRALGGHHRDDAALEHPQQQLDDLLAHPGVPAPQRRRQQREHPAHDLARQRRPGADRVRAHEVELQRRRIVGPDADAGQVADAGADAVDDAARGQRGLDHCSCRGDLGTVVGAQRGGPAAAGNALEILQRGHQARTLLPGRVLRPARRSPWSP